MVQPISELLGVDSSDIVSVIRAGAALTQLEIEQLALETLNLTGLSSRLGMSVKTLRRLLQTDWIDMPRIKANGHYMFLLGQVFAYLNDKALKTVENATVSELLAI